MPFIRVRSARGPRHEFDVPEETLKANRRAYKVLDRCPVLVARPPTFKPERPAD